MNIEDVLLQVIRSTEVFSAESARESIPGSESSALVPGVSRQRGSWPIFTSTHDTPKSQLAGRDTLHHRACCKHTRRLFTYGLSSSIFNGRVEIHVHPWRITPRFALPSFLSLSLPRVFSLSRTFTLLPSLIIHLVSPDFPLHGSAKKVNDNGYFEAGFVSRQRTMGKWKLELSMWTIYDQGLRSSL